MRDRIPVVGKSFRWKIHDVLLGYIERVHDVPRARDVSSQVHTQLKDRERLGTGAVNDSLTLVVPPSGGDRTAVPLQHVRGIDLLAEPIDIHSVKLAG